MRGATLCSSRERHRSVAPLYALRSLNWDFPTVVSREQHCIKWCQAAPLPGCRLFQRLAYSSAMGLCHLLFPEGTSSFSMLNCLQKEKQTKEKTGFCAPEVYSIGRGRWRRFTHWLMVAQFLIDLLKMDRSNSANFSNWRKKWKLLRMFVYISFLFQRNNAAVFWFIS